MTKKILSEILSASKETKSLIGLYDRNTQVDDFWVGYVIDFDDAIVVIQHITSYGVKDGIHVKEIAAFERIETESEYLKCCQLLFENHELLPRQITEKVRFSFSDSWQYHFLNDNSCIGELIAFDLQGEDFFNYGFLVDFDEESMVIHLVSQSGESQGTNVYYLNDVSSFQLDTLACRKRKAMYSHRKAQR